MLFPPPGETGIEMHETGLLGKIGVFLRLKEGCCNSLKRFMKEAFHGHAPREYIHSAEK